MLLLTLWCSQQQRASRTDSQHEVVREPGFEPGTYRLGGGRSIQLSYKRTEEELLQREALQSRE